MPSRSSRRRRPDPPAAGQGRAPPPFFPRDGMLEFSILLPAILNGLTTGAIYALIALGLTLIYGVLHIINFAHGSLLMLAMYAVFWLWRLMGIDPYVALPPVIAGAFGFGYLLYRGVIGRFSHESPRITAREDTTARPNRGGSTASGAARIRMIAG